MSGLDGTTLFSLRLSLQVALTATCFVIVIGMAAAYVLARCDFRGRQLLDILCTLPLVLPPSVTGYYLIIFFGRNGFLGSWIYEMYGPEHHVYLVCRCAGLVCRFSAAHG